MGDRLCVYTCLIGDYEKLNEQPVAAESKIDFICFTDDADLKSKTWKVVKIDPTFEKDSIRSQRIIKLSPHDFCEDYDTSLYIDNSVILRAKPEDIFERYRGRWDFLLPTHSYRASLIDEFREIDRLSLDDPKRVDEQLAHYRDTDPNCLGEKPYWSGIQIRCHTNPHTRRALRFWLAQVLRYSRRDQLSSNYAFRQVGLVPHRLNIDNFSSWFHAWPVHSERNEEIGRFRKTLPRRVLSRLRREARSVLKLCSGATSSSPARDDSGATLA